MVEPPEEPQVCTKKIAAMLLRYTGPDIANATVKFVAKAFDDDPVIYSGVNLTDGVVLLNFLFRRGSVPRCLAACDSEGSGRLSVSSAVRVLQHIFAGGPPPPAPYPECGVGAPEDRGLGCEHQPSACN